MAGGAYVAIALGFAFGGGMVGRLKGSSFWLWFLISGLIPVLGLIAALAYRSEDDEPERACPRCGRTCKLYEALCVRCGAELEYPEPPGRPESAAPAGR
jgi:fatty acid desaturase